MSKNTCVLIVMQPEPGHTLPVISIGEALLNAGHRVVFLTSGDLAYHLRDRGFLTELFGEEQSSQITTPAGYSVINSGRSFWQQFGYGVNRAEFIRKRVLKAARKYSPVLILVDHLFFRNYGLFATRKVDEVPIIFLSTSMPRWDESEIHSTVPRWVLCPSDLELDCFLQRYTNIAFTEPCIDWKRREVPCNIPKPRLGAPLILYSPGTQVMMHVNADARLNAVIAAAKSLPMCDFVVATGTNSFLREGCHMPENVTIASHIPQLQLLRRASALITHGGLGSIKEALCCGVPLLAMPVVFDQPYNAMRIRNKSLGVALFPDQVSATNIKNGLEKVLDSSVICAAVKEMQERFVAQEAARPLTYMLLAMLSKLSV